MNPRIPVIPRSHVDIGRTNTQDDVAFIHHRNILESIKFAKATAHYPGTTYYYRVCAVDTAGQRGEFSEESSVKTKP